jgi:hypothetical protein
MPPTSGMDRNGSFDHVFDNASIQVLLFPRPEKTSSKLEDDENGLFLFAANENQMEFDY